MKTTTFIFMTLLVFSVIACNQSETKNKSGEDTSIANQDEENTNESSSPEDRVKSMEEAMQEAKKSIEESGIQKTEPVNFRELQKLTPEKLGGMDRVRKSGETTGALGMNISTAEAAYKDGDGTEVEIKVIDTGGLGMGLMGMAAWSSATIDREDENGFERTATLDGYKSFEKCNTNSGRCEVSVLVESRYIVEGSCRNCEIEKLKNTIKEMGLNQMKKLK